MGARDHAPLKNIDKNGAIFLVQSECSKVCYYHLKKTIFRIINQQPKLCAILFSKINLDANDSTKINTPAFYKGYWGNSPLKPRKCKTIDAFPFLHQNQARK